MRLLLLLLLSWSALADEPSPTQSTEKSAPARAAKKKRAPATGPASRPDPERSPEKERPPAVPQAPAPSKAPAGPPSKPPATSPASSPSARAPSRGDGAPTNGDPAAVRPSTRARASTRVPETRSLATTNERHRAAYTTDDHRWARPHPRHIRHDIDPHHPRPARMAYYPWYTHWWVHPWYRWTDATVVVVDLGWAAHAWVDTWTPPPRAGWVWIPGHRAPGVWIPGHWAPVGPAPAWGGVRYIYVPGWWSNEVYLGGYWRVDARADWRWVDGYYQSDGTYVWGYWEPTTAGPRGYVWEHGYWDGEVGVDGFWRPEHREGYRWVDAWYDDHGLYHAGYWEPTRDRPGYVWIPGWFDGVAWIPGHWVTEEEYAAEDAASWTAPDGWDAGRGQAPPAEEAGEAPIALPAESPSASGE